LHFFGERSGKSVYVDLDGIPAFGFDKELVSFSFGKTVDLIFYAWAIPWADTVDATGKHGTSLKTCSQFLVHFGTGISDPAAPLGFWFFDIEVGEADDLFIARLFFHF
jgi:hypothetical protein